MNLQSLDFLRASPARLVASRLVERLGLTSRSITAQQLIDLASTRSGRRDLGDTDLTESLFGNLEHLLAAVAHGTRLTFNGRALFRQFMVETLCNRLDVVAWDRQHPNVFRAQVDAPIFIIGLPCSGITYLHQLLAQDPANRTPIAWEVAGSVPPPSAYSFAKDARIDNTDILFTAIKRRFLPSTTLPLLNARVAQDCSLLLAASGASEAFSIALQIPTYRDWLQSCDMSAPYLWHRQMLQHLQSAYMSARWVLKSPQHLGHLPALTMAYPDARFVFVHRDPEQAMTELMTLCRHSRHLLQLRTHAGDDMQDDIVHWATVTDRATDFFTSQPRFAVAHVRHSDLLRRPLKTVAAIYETLTASFSEPAYKRMDDYINRQMSSLEPITRQSVTRQLIAGSGPRPLQAAQRLTEQIATAFSRYQKTFADYLP